MRRAWWLWPVVTLTSAVGMSVLLLLQTPGRLFLAVWFLLIGAGMPFARLLGLGCTLCEWVLAVAFSLAIDCAVAGLMIYLGVWSSFWGFLTVACVSLTGSFAEVLLHKKHFTAAVG